jgi:hypothetical protein
MALLHVNEILLLPGDQNKEIKNMSAQITDMIDHDTVSGMSLLTLKYYNDMLTDSCTATITNNELLSNYQALQKKLLENIRPLYNQYQEDKKTYSKHFQEVNEFDFLNIKNYKTGEGYTKLNSELDNLCRELMKTNINKYSIYDCLVIFKMYNMLKLSTVYDFDIIAKDKDINDFLSYQWENYHKKQINWLSGIETQKNLLCQKIDKVIISNELKAQLKDESTKGGARQRKKSRSTPYRAKSRSKPRTRSKSRTKSKTKK